VSGAFLELTFVNPPHYEVCRTHRAKTVGPARLAITDRHLTFATNRDRGVLISFNPPVRGFDPLGILYRPELTVRFLCWSARRIDGQRSEPASVDAGDARAGTASQSSRRRARVGPQPRQVR
jgi:hypothetical protein